MLDRIKELEEALSDMIHAAEWVKYDGYFQHEVLVRAEEVLDKGKTSEVDTWKDAVDYTTTEDPYIKVSEK